MSKLLTCEGINHKYTFVDNPKSLLHILIVGYGNIGKFTYRELEVLNPDIYDKNMPQYNAVDKKHYDAAFVCVPTEMKPDGSADISIVEDVVSKICADVIVIKSAIPVGTADFLIEKYGKNIVVSPEFYGTTQHSSDCPNFLILGGDKKSCEKVAQIFYKVKNGSFRIRFTDTKAAELVKYMENCFLALKVTFCNEFAEAAEAVGVSYPELRELFVMDERMGESHTFVYSDKPYYDSHCLNKDVPAFINFMAGFGTYAPLMQRVYAINADKKFHKELDLALQADL